MPDERRREHFETTALPLRASPLRRGSADHGPDRGPLELVQETFLRAYRTFDNFTPGTNAKAWLFTILRSVSANRWRRGRRAPVMAPLEDWESRFGLLAAEAPSDREPTGEEVTRALARLPEDFRLVVLLVDVEGLTYDEVAAAAGCPVGTIRSRLARARRALYVELRDYARKAGYARGTP